MIHISSDLLAFSGEAALLAQQGKVLYANSAAQTALGEDCVGKTLRSLFGPDIAGAQAAAFIADALIGGVNYIVRSSKSDRTQIIFLSPAAANPAVLSDPFLCSMRNSIMNVGLSSERIRERAEELGDGLICAGIASLNRSSGRMMRMISNASLVLSLQSGSVPFAPEELNLSALCARVIETARSFAFKPELCAQIGEDISLAADAALMRILLMNLLSNCLVHAEGCTRINISLIEGRGGVVLSVSDDGCGIAPGELCTAFDRYRHEFDMGRMGGGTGLGLTVVRRIAELHGGSVLLESRPGSGATVRVSLHKDPSCAGVSLKTPRGESPEEYTSILVGLSDCVPVEYFGGRKKEPPENGG